MKYAARLALSAILLSTTLMFFSCDDGYGVFSSIQEERRVAGSEIFKSASPSAITRFNGTYYVATARIFSGKTASWAVDPISFPAPAESATPDKAIGTSYLCTGLASDSTFLYAALRDQGGASGYGIFSLSSLDGATWSSLVAQSVIGGSVEALFEANDRVFALVKPSSAAVYTVKALGATGLSSIQGLEALTSPLVGIAFDGTSYHYAIGTKLYTGTTTSAAENSSWHEVQSALGSSTKSITSIVMSGKGLCLGTADGFIYGRENGAWRTTATALTYLATGKAYRLTALIEAPVAGLAPRLIAGTGAYAGTVTARGYMEASYGPEGTEFSAISHVPGGESGALLTSSTNYDTSFKDNAVIFFRVYSETDSGKRLFASISGNGLWSKTWDGMAWSDWQAE